MFVVFHTSSKYSILLSDLSSSIFSAECGLSTSKRSLSRVVDRATRIIIFTQFTDDFPGMTVIAEPVFIQALIAKASVKTLNKSVLRRLSGLDKPQLYTMLISPLIQYSAGKLRPLVSSYRSRIHIV